MGDVVKIGRAERPQPTHPNNPAAAGRRGRRPLRDVAKRRYPHRAAPIPPWLAPPPSPRFDCISCEFYSLWELYWSIRGTNSFIQLFPQFELIVVLLLSTRQMRLGNALFQFCVGNLLFQNGEQTRRDGLSVCHFHTLPNVSLFRWFRSSRPIRSLHQWGSLLRMAPPPCFFWLTFLLNATHST